MIWGSNTMIEKRYRIINMGLDGRLIKEDGKIIELERVVDLLNENEELKEENRKLRLENGKLTHDLFWANKMIEEGWSE